MEVSRIVNELIGQTDWQPGNGLAFVLSGNGHREANAFKVGSSLRPAELRIKYVVTP